jgi:hydrogenase expression/formation protein HypD
MIWKKPKENSPVMKYIDEYRNRELIVRLAERIRRSVNGDYTFMEVCGGHTSAIHRFGLPALLPSGIRLISGPGCPVCVTPAAYIDTLVDFALHQGYIIATFGDLMRVPGTLMTLSGAAAMGADVRVVLSAAEALMIARSDRRSRVIFAAIGFETTAPGTAVTLMQAKKGSIQNFQVLSAHKLMPPAMEELIRGGTRIDGFICPGHVSVITGSGVFEFIPERYRLGCVITGFEPTDILTAVLMLVRQVMERSPEVQVQYVRAVKPEGNRLAQKFMNEVFEPSDTEWRGLGIIRSGGMKLREEYSAFDASLIPGVDMTGMTQETDCICGDILRGLLTPAECPMFKTECTPETPAGACMVSEEGACHSWYKYHHHEG